MLVMKQDEAADRLTNVVAFAAWIEAAVSSDDWNVTCVLCVRGQLQDHSAEHDTHNVVLQVLTDTGQLDVDGNVDCLENVLWADTAVHQDMGATNGSTSEDDFFGDIDGLPLRRSRGGELHRVRGEVARGRIRGEYEARDGSVGEDGEIRPRRERVDVRRA